MFLRQLAIHQVHYEEKSPEGWAGSSPYPGVPGNSRDSREFLWSQGPKKLAFLKLTLSPHDHKTGTPQKGFTFSLPLSCI